MPDKNSFRRLKILWIATAYGIYSDTRPEFKHGGVTDYLRLILDGLAELGHDQLLLLPVDSDSKHPNIVFKGTSQPTLAKGTSDAPVFPQTGSCLEKMMDYAWDHQDEFDVIINAGHDWLPHFMMGKFKTSYLSLPNLCQTVPQLDELIKLKSEKFSDEIAFFSKAQRAILGSPKCKVLKQPFDISDFNEALDWQALKSEPAYLFWAGRVTPEKGVETALEFAKSVELPLKVAGVIDPDYLSFLDKKYPSTLRYLGLLERHCLYEHMHKATALLQMQRSDWQEAFGRVTVEAMLCGCPVVYTQSGANQELVSSCNGGVFHLGSAALSLRALMQLDRKLIQKTTMNLFSTKAVAAELEQLLLAL